MAAKVLILDSKKEDREILKKSFATYDCDLLEEEDGSKLIDRIQGEKPNLVIMDPQITAGDGFAILQTLNEKNITKEIPVILLTAETKREKVIMAAKMGIKDYILKPLKPVQFTERVSRLVNIPRKTKNIKDSVQILVVDNKPLIVEQIKGVIIQGTPWEILSAAGTTEALEILSNQVPDIILISLDLPNDEGFNLFRAIRFNERTKAVPVFGMCIKNAVDEQTRAHQTGMTGIVTKPIDVDDLRQRLTRAMNLDTSQRYFETRDNILFVTFPENVEAMANEIGSYLKPQTSAMVIAGMSLLLLDLSKVNGMDTNVLRLLIQIISHCEELGVRYNVVGTSETASKAKLFEETKNMKIFENSDEALKSLKEEK